MGDQMVPEGQRRTEHREQSPAQGAFFEQGGVELIPSGIRVLREPNQGPQRGVGVGCTRQRPQQVDVRLVVLSCPAQFRQPLTGGGIDQPEPADAGQPGALGRGFGHDQNGSATRRSLRPAGSPCELQRQVGAQLVGRDVTAVVRPFRALVAQEEVKDVLPQRFRDKLGGLHGMQRTVEAGG